jgi:hypothetical protein
VSPMKRIKVNWDIDVDKNKKKMGVGKIVRDYEENVLASIYVRFVKQ